MVDFKTQFGIGPQDIQKTCVLTPFLTKGLLEACGISHLEQGNPYSSGQSKGFTLILTRIGAPFVGDAVLNLKAAPCDKLIFFGACGAVRRTDSLNIGQLVTPAEAFCYESFSQLLARQFNPLPSRPQSALLERTQQAGGLLCVRCASLGSFYLQEEMQPLLLEKDIQVVDMECAAFFLAAESIKKAASSILYITDIIKERHVFAPLSEADKRCVEGGIAQGLRVIKSLAE